MLFPLTRNKWSILPTVVWFQFVLAAQHICQKLRNAGCWADFINPFSGAPAVGAYARKQNPMESNESSHSLEFSITERHHCRVIEDKKTRSFIGEYLKLFISPKKLAPCDLYRLIISLLEFLREKLPNSNYRLWN